MLRNFSSHCMLLLSDAKITGWNLRDKKIASLPMTHIRPKDFPFEGDRAKNFVPIYKQSSYKYLIYAEGHCAACRYGFMMQLGSVILKVDSKCVADQMWYFPLLRPYYDHVPVKADLSDLREKLEWCHAHDEECHKIAAQAKEVYSKCLLFFVTMKIRHGCMRAQSLAWAVRRKCSLCPLHASTQFGTLLLLHGLMYVLCCILIDKYISRDGILDYLQVMCVEISKRWRRTAAEWCGPAPAVRPTPSVVPPGQLQYHAPYCTEVACYQIHVLYVCRYNSIVTRDA